MTLKQHQDCGEFVAVNSKISLFITHVIRILRFFLLFWIRKTQNDGFGLIFLYCDLSIITEIKDALGLNTLTT